MFIDTHCHLNFNIFNKDLDNVVRRAIDAGVGQMIVPGTDLVSSSKAVDLALKYPQIYAAVGIHPHHAQDDNLVVNGSLKDQLIKLIERGGIKGKKGPSYNKASESKIVAIGEIGLDFFVYQHTKYQNNQITAEIKNKQIKLLQMQISLAQQYQLPLILHCRESYPQMINIMLNNSRINPARNASHSDAGGSPAYNYINQYQSSVKTKYINPHHPLAGGPGVFHCFSGSTSQLQLLITMGYYVGFDGNITYTNEYSPLVKLAPLNRILLETDSPYLTPIPYRSQTNEPKNIPLIASEIAKFKATSLSKVEKTTTDNAKKLFNL